MLDNIIEKNKKFIDFLGLTLGPDYEFALYDMEADPPSIIAITNGSVSGRSIGSELAGSEAEIIQNKTYLNQDWVANYSSDSPSGRSLRCSALFLKDEERKLIGLLTISFDGSRTQNLLEMLMSMNHPYRFIQTGISSGSAAAADTRESKSSISAALNEAVEAVAPSGSAKLTKTERTQILTILDRKGVFQLKGAVPLAAQRLSCSVASIYRYLGEIRQ